MMYDGIPKGLLRLSRRMTRPGAVSRALRQVSDLMNTSWVTPPPAQGRQDAPAPPPAPPRARPPRPVPERTPSPGRAPFPSGDSADRAGDIVEIAAFGTNPGALRMLMYAPASLPASGAPLVVVLHGCGQNAAQFATESGWIALADRLGLAVVMPEQVAANNAGRCFNWFRAEDIARGEGEVLSIRQMVEAAMSRKALDPRRVFVVGLSAGGAMAAAMLAAYPDLFAAGASVAGLPVGCASDVSSALARMARAGSEPAATLADRARACGPKPSPRNWPRISIWQGDGDQTVVPANAGQIAAQFAALHGLAGDGEVLAAPPCAAGASVAGRGWRDAGGIAVELWSVPGMSHGYPIAAGAPQDRFVLPIGLDATDAIAGFWGLRAGAAASPG